MGQAHRRRFVLASGALLAAPLSSLAQQPARKVRRIGVLSPHAKPPPGSTSPFREVLRRAGYEVGKNLVIEARYADAKPDRLPELAQELVRLNVELIVALENAATDAAKRATQTTPIVMYANMFPVERGLIASLGRPGGSVTGTVWHAQPKETALKMSQLLREAVPNAKRPASLSSDRDPLVPFYDVPKLLRNIADLGLEHRRISIAQDDDFRTVLNLLKLSRPDILVVAAFPVVRRHWREIAAFAVEQRIVSISDSPGYLSAGGLLTYGPDAAALAVQNASYVVRILKGAKPGELAVEQAHKYVMAINAKTAQAIGFKPPPSFMLRVDKVIE